MTIMNLTFETRPITIDQAVAIIKVMIPAEEQKRDIVRHQSFRFRQMTETSIGASVIKTNHDGDTVIVGPADDIDYVMGVAFQA